jgi:integral membrane protein
MTTQSPSAASVLHSGAYKRFQVMAWVTGVLLAVMTVIGLPWKYLLGNEGSTWYAVGWQLHGFLYMAYLVTVLDVAIRARWAPGRTVLVALAGTIPFMSFVFERRITHQLRRDEQAVAAVAVDAPEAAPEAAP